MGPDGDNVAEGQAIPNGVIVSIEFEVYGQVQGVYFTKYCKDTCDMIGLSGWVKNSRQGTIVGKVQGEKPKVEEIIQWLSRTGSPGSKIDHAEIRHWEYMNKPEFRNFSIRF